MSAGLTVAPSSVLIGEPVRQPTGGQHADQHREGGQQHDDAGDQGFLVVRPEVRDRELLDRHGVRLIAVSPTATTGAPFGPVTAAVSSATPSATAPVSRPTRPDF